MRSINFNDNFSGFEENEDILLDTNVIYAFLNPFDAWHSTIRDLFNNYILSDSINLFLYTHSGIVNEVTYLSRDPLRKYAEYHGMMFSEQDIATAVRDITKTSVIGGFFFFPRNSYHKIYPFCRPSLAWPAEGT